jgi:cytidylate kinase
MNFFAMTGRQLKDNINTLDSRFNIRMFIADLPRVLNETFSVIKNAFGFYDAENNKIEITRIDVGTLQASTVITNNIAFKDSSSNKTINFQEIEEISNRYNAIPEIQDAIDSLQRQINEIKNNNKN